VGRYRVKKYIKGKPRKNKDKSLFIFRRKKEKKRRKVFNLPNLSILFGLLLLFLALGPLLKDEIWFKLKEWKAQDYILMGSADSTVEDSVFARYLSTRDVSIQPVNTDFSIVIERIGVNAPIVKEVSILDEKKYVEALKGGVAHAIVSPPPSRSPGNTYLFAHSSINFWQLGKYATVFNLLRKLDYGDRVHVFYEGDDYTYEVVNKEVLDGWNTYPITRAVVEPTLTLQTCDPPGTTINRLVVTATLLDVKKYEKPSDTN
jgi:LPXTG-site transpeptidase (sortase) family protein